MRYLILTISILLGITGQLLLKKGIVESNLALGFIPIIKTLFSPFVLLGFSSYAISSLIWLFVLQRFPLSVAYPSLSTAYVVIILSSWFFFHEPLTITKIAGATLIVSGVYFLFR